MEQNEIDDWKHRLLVNAHVKLLTRPKSISELDVEVPFSSYGLRGVIDILVKSPECMRIIEVKPRLINLNEAIRQLKTAKTYYKSSYPYNNNLYLCKDYFRLEIVTFCSTENIKIIMDNLETILVANIMVYFYKVDKLTNECKYVPVVAGGNMPDFDNNLEEVEKYKKWVLNQITIYLFDLKELKKELINE